MGKHRTKAIRGIAIHEGSGNVYADLGYRNADDMLVKAELVRKISEIVRSRRFTLLETAKACPSSKCPVCCADSSVESRNES